MEHIFNKSGKGQKCKGTLKSNTNRIGNFLLKKYMFYISWARMTIQDNEELNMKT